MDPLQPWIADFSNHPLLRMVTGDGLARAAVFILVAARLAGFFCIGPMLGRTVVSWPVRIGLVVLLTLIVAPGIPIAQPDDSTVLPVSHEQRETSFDDDSTSSAPGSTWASPAGMMVAILCDAGIGAAVGLAVAIFLSGLKLGGEWLDRHSGLGMGSVLNPEFSAGGSAPAEFASLFCVAVILVMQPVNGHLLVVRFVLDTFHAIPIHAPYPSLNPEPVTMVAFKLIKALLQQSLILGLRIAMPFVVAMSLLDMTLGWVRRSSRWELTPAAYTLRAGAALLIMAATFPGIQEAVSSSLYETLKIANDVHG